MKSAPDPKHYVGRFAPSPTGDLHFGSLIAAVGSYLQAKSRNGTWLIRVEDIDPPREVKGSAQKILDDLKRFGMEPDRPALYQSSHIGKFRQVRQALIESDRAFYCSCSRSSLPPTGIYPGTCRKGATDRSRPLSTRIRTNQETVKFTDGLQGQIRENLADICGDFVIWRADDLPAYQLAVVLDDAWQGVTEVVRGADLLDSTGRQIYLQTCLGLPKPAYIHLPIATHQGKKLGKRYQSDPVASRKPLDTLRMVLEFLGHTAPDDLSLESLWRWAIDHWNIQNVPAKPELPTKGWMEDS